MLVCHVCGTNNADGAKFCEGCGVELQTPVAAASTAAPQAADAPETSAPPVVSDALTNPSPTVQETLQGQLSAHDVTGVVEAEAAAVVANPAVAPAVDAVAAPVVPVEAVVAPAPDPALVPAPAVAAVVAPAPAVGAGPAAARLVPRQFGALGTSNFPLNGTRLSVGRFDPSTGPVDIDLSGLPGDSHVSRRHGEVFLENGVWMVRDLGSTNGVYLKKKGDASFGPRIQAPAQLHDGDEIAFGNVMFVYQDDTGGTVA